MEAHTTYRDADASTARPIPLPDAGEHVRASLERLLERLGPEAVFGAPVRHGDVLVVPVAEVGVGLGFGSGFGTDGAAEAPKGDAPTGGGGGGGVGGRAVPRGFIRVAEGRARFVPAVDATRVVLSGLAFGTLAALILGRTLVRADASAPAPARKRFWRRP